MAQVAMRGLPLFEGENMGGLMALRIALTGAWPQWAEPVQGVVIVPDPEDAPLHRCTISLESGSYQEEPLGGGAYRCRVRGFVPKDTIPTRQRLTELVRQAILAEVDDANGITHRIGEPRNAASVSTTYGTGANAAARNGHWLTIEWTAASGAPIMDQDYVPDLSHIDDDGGGDDSGSNTDILGWDDNGSGTDEWSDDGSPGPILNDE